MSIVVIIECIRMNIQTAIRQCHSAIPVSMLHTKLLALALCDGRPADRHTTAKAEDITTAISCWCRVTSTSASTVIAATSCCRTVAEVDKSRSSHRRECVVVVLSCRLHDVQGQRERSQVEEFGDNEWSEEEQDESNEEEEVERCISNDTPLPQA